MPSPASRRAAQPAAPARPAAPAAPAPQPPEPLYLVYWSGQMHWGPRMQDGLIIVRPHYVAFLPTKAAVNMITDVLWSFAGFHRISIGGASPVQHLLMELTAATPSAFDAELRNLLQEYGGRRWSRSGAQFPANVARRMNIRCDRYRLTGKLAADQVELLEYLLGLPASAPSGVPFPESLADDEVLDACDVTIVDEGDGALDAEVIDDLPVGWEHVEFLAQPGEVEHLFAYHVERPPPDLPGEAPPEAPEHYYEAKAIADRSYHRGRNLRDSFLYAFLALLGIVISIVVLSRGPARDPAPVDLAALEAGGDAPDSYIDVGPHVACYYAGIVVTRKKRGARADDEGQIRSFLYPIISESHPAARELLDLVEQYGSLDDLPEDVHLPALEYAAAVVETRRYERWDDIPHDPVRVERVEGIYDRRLPFSGGLEANSGIPDQQLLHAMRIQEGKTPSVRSTGSLIGGFACLAITILIAYLACRAAYRLLTGAQVSE